ncbi:hypothetical protein ATO13_22391 [Stappia sp. 22II-S9-Z10]|nr:hypothetical protein ATO13_22391 [Stappia sp. 22II-S9-Z10]
MAPKPLPDTAEMQRQIAALRAERDKARSDIFALRADLRTATAKLERERDLRIKAKAQLARLKADQPARPKPHTFATVSSAVARQCGLPADAIVSRHRSPEHLYARRLAVHVATGFFGLPVPQVARAMGFGPDNIRYYQRTAADEISTDPAGRFALDAAQVISVLGA